MNSIDVMNIEVMQVMRLSEVPKEELPVYIQHLDKFYIMDFPVASDTILPESSGNASGLVVQPNRLSNVFFKEAYAKVLKDRLGGLEVQEVKVEAATENASNANFAAVPKEDIKAGVQDAKNAVTAQLAGLFKEGQEAKEETGEESSAEAETSQAQDGSNADPSEAEPSMQDKLAALKTKK